MGDFISERDALNRRIEARKRLHQPTADLEERKRQLVLRQLRRETGPKRRRKVA